VIATAVNPERPRSARVELARLAAAVIAADPAVEPNVGSPGRWLTPDADELIEGVVAAEGAEGVEIELHLTARWPAGPLPQVAETLRGALRKAARKAGLGPRLGAVSVSFHDIDLGGSGAVR
jgi:hypothetical protein